MRVYDTVMYHTVCVWFYSVRIQTQVERVGESKLSSIAAGNLMVGNS